MSDRSAVGPSIYVYGLLHHAAALDGDGLGAGIGGHSVRLVSNSGLTALVSTVEPGSVAQTRRNMVAHTAVLERVLAKVTVLPLRFGTVAPSEAALSVCVAGNAASLIAALRGVDGRVELGVKASWRDGVVFDEIISADHGLRALRDRLRSRPASETYYERVELGRRIEAALAVRRAAETADILRALMPLAERQVELRTLADDMILNRAFLVLREHEEVFDNRMQAIVEDRGARLQFRYVGPVPPYNFVQLHTDWLAAAT
jgi:hypothetical protein